MNSNLSYSTNNITKSDRMLHTPSEFARKNLLYIQEVGKLKSLKPHVSSRSELDSYLFFIVLKGSGSVTISDKTYRISENKGVLISCMDAYQHISDEDNPWELAWIHFNGKQAAGFYELFAGKNKSVPVFGVKDKDFYEHIVSSVMSYQDDKDIMAELDTSLRLTELLTEIIKDVTENNNNDKEHNLSKLRETVNERFMEPDLLEKLCHENNYEEITINREYKEKYGIDLCDYILNRRFTYAKELLRFTVKPVKEVVNESGICNSDLFRHLFIENEGMTAEEYREKWSQWNRG